MPRNLSLLSLLTVNDTFFEGIKHFVRREEHPSHTSVVSYRHATFSCKAYIFYHLTGIELYREEALYLLAEASNFVISKRPKSNRTEKTDLDTALTSNLYHLLANTSGRPEGYEHVVGIICHIFFVANFVLSDFGILSLEAFVVLFHYGRVEL